VRRKWNRYGYSGKHFMENGITISSRIKITIVVIYRQILRKNGISYNGKQRFLCLNESCPRKIFIENYTYKAYYPFIRSLIFFMAVNGCGTQATARALGIAKDTDTLRNIEPLLWYVNYDYLNAHKDSGITGEIVPVSEAEIDEMWSFVGDKSRQYWLWRAVDHNMGEPLAFHFGTGEHKNLDALLELLKPFNINTVYSDDNSAYKSLITGREVVRGKKKTQKIERKHVWLRTKVFPSGTKGNRFFQRFSYA
jgi:IS1 family transposase/transposase-like protein